MPAADVYKRQAYNGYVQAGEDKEFGRAADTLAKLEGPFYAIKTCPYVMLTKGGPLMNPDAQTLNADHEPIPGLYQCGELTGGANVGGSANIGGLANTSCIAVSYTHLDVYKRQVRHPGGADRLGQRPVRGRPAADRIGQAAA